MKVTKSQLKAIIKEGRRRLLYEQAEHPYDTAKWKEAEITTSENDAVDAILNDLINSGVDQSLIDEVEEAINYDEDMEYILSLIPAEIKDTLGQAPVEGTASGGMPDFVQDAAAPPMSNAARTWSGQNGNESLEDSLKTIAKAFQEDYKNNHHPYIQLIYRMALDGKVEELKQKAVDDLRTAVKSIKPTKKETQKDRDDGIYRGNNMVQDLEAMADAPGSYSLSRWMFSLRARPKKVLDLLPLTESRGIKMKVTRRQLRRIIREAIFLEQAKPKRILSTDPESQKVYAMKYPAQAVGRYAGHEAKGASDPEVTSAASSTGVEIEAGSRGVGFTVIGNKHSLLEFDKAYREATKSIRAKIESEHGTYDERSDVAWAERTGRIPGKGLNDLTGKEAIGYDGAKAQKKAYAAGRGEAGAQVLATAFDEMWMNKYPVDFKSSDEGMPSIKFAKKISDGPWPRK